MHPKLNQYLRQLLGESNMVVQKIVHELPALGIVNSNPFSCKDDDPADNEAVMGDFDRFMHDVMVSMREVRKGKDAHLLQFIFGQADVQAATGMLPDLPADGDDVAIATWLGKAKMMGFKDAVLNAWSME